MFLDLTPSRTDKVDETFQWPKQHRSFGLLCPDYKWTVRNQTDNRELIDGVLTGLFTQSLSRPGGWMK